MERESKRKRKKNNSHGDKASRHRTKHTISQRGVYAMCVRCTERCGKKKENKLRSCSANSSESSTLFYSFYNVFRFLAVKNKPNNTQSVYAIFCEFYRLYCFSCPYPSIGEYPKTNVLFIHIDKMRTLLMEWTRRAKKKSNFIALESTWTNRENHYNT